MSWLLPVRSQICMFVHVYGRVSVRPRRCPTRPRRIGRPGEGLLSAHGCRGGCQRRDGRSGDRGDHREECQGLKHGTEPSDAVRAGRVRTSEEASCQGQRLRFRDMRTTRDGELRERA